MDSVLKNAIEKLGLNQVDTLLASDVLKLVRELQSSNHRDLAKTVSKLSIADVQSLISKLF